VHCTQPGGGSHRGHRSRHRPAIRIDPGLDHHPPAPQYESQGRDDTDHRPHGSSHPWHGRGALRGRVSGYALGVRDPRRLSNRLERSMLRRA
jgi:hypothetical protein